MENSQNSIELTLLLSEWPKLHRINPVALSIAKNYGEQPKLHRINPIALRMAKTLLSFGCSECNRVNSMEFCQNSIEYSMEFWLF